MTRRAEFAGADDIETTLRREHEEASVRLAAASEQLVADEAAVASLSERTDAAQQTWFRLSALAERVSATVRIASERAQHLDAEPAVRHRSGSRGHGGRGGANGRTGRRLLAELAHARAGLEAARAELAEKRAQRPRPSARTWPPSARRPIAGKVWPG